jgi:hypothetical protein
LLAFTSVYFFESSNFNGLRLIQTKIFWLQVSRLYLLARAGPARTIPRDFAPLHRSYPAAEFAITDNHSEIFWFTQENVH